MKIRAIMMLGTVCASLTATADNYTVGHKWIAWKDGDWTPRTAADHGTTNGNPDDDAFGMPVWSYEYHTGVSAGARLDSETPWYTYSTEIMTWDNNWAGTGNGLWAAGDNTLPCAQGNAVYSEPSASNVALQRWINPSLESKEIRLSEHEEASVFIPSYGGILDMAICHWDDSEGVLDVLYSNTFNNEGSDRSYFSYDLTLVVDPGDSVMWTSYFVTGGDWGVLKANPSVEVIPEPASAMLIAVAGCAGWWIRRTFLY